MNLNLTRLIPPDPRGTLQRNRLLKPFNCCAPAIWITGPPGSGKSTLVASYLKKQDLPFVYYRVDAEDKEPEVFLQNLIQCFSSKGFKMNPLSWTVTGELLNEMDTLLPFLEKLFLIPEAAFVFVLEDIDSIENNSFMVKLLSCIHTILPSNCRMVITSHEPVECAIKVFEENIEIIDEEHLRFNADETRQLLGAKDNRYLQRALELTNGRAITLSALRGSTDLSVFKKLVPEFSPEDILYFLLRARADTLSKGTKEFLIKTSQLEVFNLQAATELTHVKHPQRFISTLVSSGISIQRYHRKHSWYKYHPLVKTFLEQWIEAELKEEEIVGLRQRSAETLCNLGLITDALFIYKKERAWDKALNIILKKIPEELHKGNRAIIRKWLSFLPEQITARNPDLLFYNALVKLDKDPGSAKELFKRALELFKKDKNPAGIVNTLTMILNTYQAEMNRFEQMDPYIQELKDIIDNGKTEISFPAEMEALNALFVALLYRKPESPTLKQHSERLKVLFQQCPEIELKIKTGLNLLLYYCWMGDIVSAEFMLNEVLSMTEHNQPVTPFTVLHLKTVQSLLYWIKSEYAQCISAAQEGLSLSRESGIGFFNFFLYSQAFYGSLMKRQLQRAQEYLTLTEGHINRFQMNNLAQLYYMKAMMYYQNEQLHHALRYIKEAAFLIKESGTPFPQALILIGLSYCLLRLGRYRKAKQIISTVDKINRKIQSPFLEYSLLLLKAVYSLRYSSLKKTTDNLMMAFKLGKKMGYILTDTWLFPYLPRLCIIGIEKDIEPEYIETIIRYTSLKPDRDYPYLEKWPWPFRIYTFGGFRIFKEQNRKYSQLELQKKPSELLKLILSSPYKEVSALSIMEALWGDQNGDYASWSFKTTIKRLRSAFGNKEVILVKDGKVSLNEELCWVDAYEFERVYDSLEKVKDSGRLKLCMENSDMLLNLYRGDFLAGDEEHFSIQKRETFRMKILRTIYYAGFCYEQAGKLRKAASWYEKGLEIDLLSEEFYQRLMLCHHHLGNSAKAIQVYNKCKDVLNRFLSIAPSERTEEILKLILTA